MWKSGRLAMPTCHPEGAVTARLGINYANICDNDATFLKSRRNKKPTHVKNDNPCQGFIKAYRGEILLQNDTIYSHDAVLQ